MKNNIFIQTAYRSFFKKICAGVLMLALNLSTLGAGIFLPTSVVYATTVPTTTLFSDGFEANNFTKWSTHDSNWTLVHSSALSGSVNAKIIGGITPIVPPNIAPSIITSILQLTTSTLGFNNIQLSYKYKATQSFDLSDHVFVEWSTNGTTWNSVTTHTGGAVTELNPVVSVTFTLPPETNNNANLSVRFRALLNSPNDDFRLDDVLLTGVDAVAPDTSFVTVPPLLTNSTSALFRFTSTEESVSFQCALDTAEFSSCSSPLTFTVTEGTHTFRVRAIDAAGNIDPTPASYTWTVDTTPPTVTITAPTQGGTTGSTGTILYTVSDGSVSCTLDGHALSCDTSGSFSFIGLSDGNHAFTVSATDAVGNTGATKVTWTVSSPVVCESAPVDEETNSCPLTDLCPNIEGAQATIPTGKMLSEGQCVDIPPVDVCPNLEGAQGVVPQGYQLVDGSCQLIVLDVCSNIEGTQASIPEGKMLSEGLCVDIPPKETPPTPTPTPTPTPEGGGSATFDYWGCTDTTAPNYNSAANKDDGSCTHPEVLGAATTTNIGGSASTTPPIGEVLGAATTTDALPEGCGEYIKDYLKYGKKNNPEEVKKLQSFLNETMSGTLKVTGFFGKLTQNLVKQFQSKYHDEIIKPWKDAGYKGKDLEQGSGYVYKTTKRKINLLKCASLNIPLPDLKGEI